MNEDLRTRIRRIRNISIAIALVAAALTVWGVFLDTKQFLHSYLFATFFWTGLSLGCLALLMLHFLVGGHWGLTLRRILESGMWPLLLMAVLFIPILFGIEQLYHWPHEDLTPENIPMAPKSVWLNEPFFIGRAIGYFAVWLILVLLITFLSRTQPPTFGTRARFGLRALSAPGLILYVLTVTFASIDWVMSLDAHWFSSIFGVLVIVGQSAAGLAMSILVLCVLSRQPPLAQFLDRDTLIDLGNLLMASIILWAYMSFSQFLIIWAGDITEEIPWYLRRSAGGWEWVALALALFHFFVPFFALLMRDIKRRVRWLGLVALLIVAMHAVDTFWLIMPEYYTPELSIHWLDIAAFVAVGAFWFVVFAIRLQARELLPERALSMQGALKHA